MKRQILLILALFALILFPVTGHAQSAATDAPAIDFNKARALLERERAGEKLDAGEAAYLARAKEMHRKQGGAPQVRNQRPAPERLTPITDLTGDARYEGQEGGLYGGGSNEPSPALREKAVAELAQIKPLDAAGKPSADGKIVFISISMSNATQEFSRFKQMADQSDKKAAHTVVVDCAQGGQAMAEWAPADAAPWRNALRLIENKGVTPQQVQVAWVKLANKGPSGTLDEHGKKLENDTIHVLQNAKAKFPNLRIAYLGSRIWAGNGKGGLNPEPYAYESAFVVRWLIQRQVSGDAGLALDKAPLLLWGPYLWAEGERGRKIDDLKWLPGDFSGDGIHPSDSGRDKVAKLLLDFMTSDPLAKGWFAR